MEIEIDEYGMVGKRITVTSVVGKVDLGLGTYLWNNELLLDTGKKIMGKNCNWKPIPPSPVPPFEFDLIHDARIFISDRSFHRYGVILKGVRVKIEEISTKPYNHGDYVAGKFLSGGKEYWLLISEIRLPEEKPPHLRIVA